MYENQKQYQQEKNLQYTTCKDRVAAVFHNDSFTSESIHLKTEEISINSSVKVAAIKLFMSFMPL